MAAAEAPSTASPANHELLDRGDRPGRLARDRALGGSPSGEPWVNPVTGMLPLSILHRALHATAAGPGPHRASSTCAQLADVALRQPVPAARQRRAWPAVRDMRSTTTRRQRDVRRVARSSRPTTGRRGRPRSSSRAIPTTALVLGQRLAVRAEDGVLVAMCWTRDVAAQRDLSVHIAWGAPDGRTWSAPDQHRPARPALPARVARWRPPARRLVPPRAARDRRLDQRGLRADVGPLRATRCSTGAARAANPAQACARTSRATSAR